MVSVRFKLARGPPRLRDRRVGSSLSSELLRSGPHEASSSQKVVGRPGLVVDKMKLLRFITST